MTVAEAVIERFGGIAALARKLGHSNRSTVQGWQESGRIPLQRWPDIERLAAEEGFPDITAVWLGEQHALQEVERARA